MSNNPVAESLKKVLASSYILSLKTQNYHWNVKGPHFKQLHDLFGEQYNELILQ
jgi:starvation-inducible DNA-binding protein